MLKQCGVISLRMLEQCGVIPDFRLIRDYCLFIVSHEIHDLRLRRFWFDIVRNISLYTENPYK